MENVINKILQIDEEACKRLTEAEQKKKQIISEAKNEESKIKDEHMQRADARLKKVDEYEKTIAEEKIVAINAEKDKKIARLNEIYEKNHIIWEHDILKRIVGE